MNSMVLNTLTRAVSEYSSFAFQSLTAHHGGDVTGLYALGGDTDNGRPIEASFRTPPQLLDATQKKALGTVYFAMRGQGEMGLTVHGAMGAWDYEFPVREGGMSRCVTGKGIRETYLAVTVRNLFGNAFCIDRIESTDVKLARKV